MSIDDMLLRLDAAARALGGTHWAIEALVALATVCGLVLWLSGARLLKPMIIVLGALCGAALGFIIGPMFGGLSAADAPHPAGAYGLVLGLPAGALIGAVLYRSATAVALGVALGAAAPLCAAGLLELHVRPTGEVLSAAPGAGGAFTPLWRAGPPAHLALADTLDFQLPRSLPAGLNADALAIPANLLPAADRAKEAIQTAAVKVEERLSAIPSQQRAVLVLSSLGGLALGIVIGLMAPAWAAGACAAMLGSALALGGGTWLSGSLGAPWAQSGGSLDRPPMQWLSIWAVAAALGLCFQGFWAWRKRG